LPLFNRALAYRLQGDHAAAVDAFTEVIRVRPQHAVAFYNRGMACCGLQDYDRALEDFGAALRLDPKFAKARAAWVEATRAKQEREERKPTSEGTPEPSPSAQPEAAPDAADDSSTSEGVWKTPPPAPLPEAERGSRPALPPLPEAERGRGEGLQASTSEED